MKKILFILFLISNNSFAKTVNLDDYLENFYNHKEYKKCYDLAMIIKRENFGEYYLEKFDIKYNCKFEYISNKTEYYLYNSLKHIDIESFYYLYVIKNDIVSKYLEKSEYSKFINWCDSLYHAPEGIDNKTNVKNRFKLNEIYKLLMKTDIESANCIFDVDNSELIRIVKNRQVLNVLNLPSKDFTLIPIDVDYSTVISDIQSDLCKYFNELFENYKFVNEQQIVEFLFDNTHFTDEEKMLVSYYFIHQFISYDMTSGMNSYNEIHDIILYRSTVCNGYAQLLNYLLRKNDIKSYHITLKCPWKNFDLHANNLVVINNRVYYVDVTWDIYYRDINTLPDKKIIKKDNILKTFDYINIKNFDYIIDVENFDNRIVGEFKQIKKGL